MSEASQAVFLSYASQDAEAARRIAEALRAAGVEVWFDQSELVGGDAWDAKIRGQIASCALFVPVISAATQARREGYFRLEWKLAAQRTQMMSERAAFLLPVVIDGTSDAEADVPAEFRAVQWTRLPGGEVAEKFGERVRALFAPESDVGRGRRTPPSSGAHPKLAGFGDPALQARRRWVMVVGGAGLVLAAAAVFWLRHPVAETTAPPRLEAVAAKPAISDKSIAVLPFANMSEDKDNNAFFADGIQEDVLTNLGAVRSLRVVSRTSVAQYRETTKSIRQIGEELRVAYVLEGSVRRAGRTVRVTGQLIHAVTDEHIWAKSYDRDLTDIFAVQAELAQDIARALRAALSPQEQAGLERRPTESVAAYDLFLKARDWRKKTGGSGNITGTISLLSEAVALDPAFALAWAELGDCHAQMAFDEYDRTPTRLANARTAIDTAVRLAPDDPGVIARVGAYYYHSDRDYVRATEQYFRLAALRPNDPEVLRALGEIQVRQGRWAEGVANLRRAQEIDPGNFGETHNLIFFLEDARHYAEAEALARNLVRTNPELPAGWFAAATIAFKARGSVAESEAFARRRFDPSQRAQVAFYLKILARFRGDTAEATRLHRDDPYWDGAGWRWVQDCAAAVTLANANDMPAAQTAATAALALMTAGQEGQAQAANSWLFAWMGQMHALLGHKTEALACGQRALEILPESRDAVYGVENALVMASIHAWVGNRETALAEFARLLKTPHGTNVFTAAKGAGHRVAQVSFKPLWDDPRFQALLNDPKNNAPLF